jgi:hypothetical protein
VPLVCSNPATVLDISMNGAAVASLAAQREMIPSRRGTLPSSVRIDGHGDSEYVAAKRNASSWIE